MIFSLTEKKRQGFTLFETVVVLGLLAFLTAIILARYPYSGRTFQVHQAAQEFASVLREAQTRALAGAVYSGCGANPTGGFGIFIQSPTSYIIYTNCDDSTHSWNAGAPTANLRTVTLASSISIDQMNQYIYFVPPQALVCTTNTADCSDSLNSVTFTLTGPTKSRIVEVSKTGQIDIK